MTLRIFQVSTDGVAVAVEKNGTDREIPPPRPSAAAPATVATPAAAAAPERWTGSSEWDRLRSRLRETEPSVEPHTRRRR